MTPDEILDIPAAFLTEDQRRFYFKNGYLLLERIVSDTWIQQLRQATQRVVQQSRAQSESAGDWRLAADHSANAPSVLSLGSPTDHFEGFWSYVSGSILPDLVADIVGPDVKYHHSVLQFSQAAEDTAPMGWRQDIQFWPHTNFSPCTVTTHLFECAAEQGPMLVLPGSHEGPLYDQPEGCLAPADLESLDLSRAVPLTVPGGSLVIHNCRLVYGFQPSQRGGRPVLWTTFSAADAFPYTANPYPSIHDQRILRGGPVRWARHDPGPCPLPHDEKPES